MSALRMEVERLATIVESDALAMTYQSLGQYRRDLLEVIRGALALPEADGWRPASDRPTGGRRRVLVWHKQGGFGGTWYSPGHWDEEVWPLGTVTHYRDVQPPTEGA